MQERSSSEKRPENVSGSFSKLLTSQEASEPLVSEQPSSQEPSTAQPASTLVREPASEDELPDELLGEQAREKSDYQLDESATDKNQVSGVGAGKPLEQSPYSTESPSSSESSGDDFEVAVVTSRSWDSREAGKELARKLHEKLKHQPKFILLFTTIHYEKYGGFQPILDEIYNVFPEEVPLVGGTIAGFMNQEGAYTRGATAMAVYSDKTDVVLGVGHNIKRNQKEAANEVLKKINEPLLKSKRKNTVIIDIISGVTVPSIPGMNKIVVIRNKLLASLSIAILKISSIIFQKGIGREEIVLNEIKNKIGKTVGVFGGSTMDNVVFSRSFEFANKEVLKNSVVLLSVMTDLNFEIKGGHGFNQRGDRFYNITTGAWDRVIATIDGKPAVGEYLNKFNWSYELVNENTFHRRFIFNPVGFVDSEGKLQPFVAGGFFGGNYVGGGPIQGNKICYLQASGKDLLNTTDQLTDATNSKGIFFFTYCGSRLEAFGAWNYKVQERLTERLKQDFLVISTTGENYCQPSGKMKVLTVTFNLLKIA